MQEYEHEWENNNHIIKATAYDYAGNEASIVLEEELKIGNIFYKDGTCSNNYYSFQIPVGIVSSLIPRSSAFNGETASIWCLDEVPPNTYQWGLKGYATGTDETDGSNLRYQMKIASTVDCVYEGTIDYYMENVYAVSGQNISWYIPSIAEYKDIISKKDILQKTADLLNENGVPAVVLGGTIYGTANSIQNQYYCVEINGNESLKNKESSKTTPIGSGYPSYHFMSWNPLK